MTEVELMRIRATEYLVNKLRPSFQLILRKRYIWSDKTICGKIRRIALVDIPRVYEETWGEILSKLLTLNEVIIELQKDGIISENGGLIIPPDQAKYGLISKIAPFGVITPDGKYWDHVPNNIFDVPKYICSFHDPKKIKEQVKSQIKRHLPPIERPKELIIESEENIWEQMGV